MYKYLALCIYPLTSELVIHGESGHTLSSDLGSIHMYLRQYIIFAGILQSDKLPVQCIPQDGQNQFAIVWLVDALLMLLEFFLQLFYIEV